MVAAPDTFPFMVIGNKCDMDDGCRAVQRDQAEEFCRANGNMDYIETSAKDNINVEAAFVRIARQALKRQESL